MKPNQVNTASIPVIGTCPLASIDTALRSIFTSPQEETLLVKSRQIMGECVADLSDEELEVYNTELQHLIDYWLDGFERQQFNGQTLQQMLGQG